MEALLDKTTDDRAKLIEDIEKNSGDYMPAVFFALANDLWNSGNKRRF